jgi:hypothetical protein
LTGDGLTEAVIDAEIGVSPAGCDKAQLVVPVGVLAAPAGPAVATRPTVPTRPAAAIAATAPSVAKRADSARDALIYVSPDVC